MSGHLSRAQIDLIDQYDAGSYGDTEFRGLALEVGLSHAQIDGCIRDRMLAERIVEENATEAATSGRQFGLGA